MLERELADVCLTHPVHEVDLRMSAHLLSSDVWGEPGDPPPALLLRRLSACCRAERDAGELIAIVDEKAGEGFLELCLHLRPLVF